MNWSQTTEWKYGRALPQIVTEETKYRVGLLIFGFSMLLYMASNHHPVFSPRLLPMSWIDQATPFAPWSVWIYVTDYGFALVVYALCRDVANLNKLCYSFLALQLMSISIFFAWPTTYPRELFPLPSGLDAATAYVFSFLRTMDAPGNCLPSLHVSSAFLASFVFLDEQKGKFPWFLSWATLIAASTLTTKQHYLADVLSAVALAIVLYLFFHRWVAYGATANTSDAVKQLS